MQASFTGRSLKYQGLKTIADSLSYSIFRFGKRDGSEMALRPRYGRQQGPKRYKPWPIKDKVSIHIFIVRDIYFLLQNILT